MTNTKSTKRALLASVMALLVCFSMLLGTTFAWFTDSVTSAGNIIQTGTLDVSMEWLDGTVAPTDDAAWIDASEGAIFESTLWEPGYVEVRHIKIANEGTLALKYQLQIVANGEVSELTDVIDVYYIDPAVQVTDRTQLTDENKLGTLTEVLANLDNSANGNLLVGKETTITLALKMQETAGNEYQNLSIGADFSIMLFATQYTSENDSFDNQYDANAGYDMPWDGETVTAPVADENGVYHITNAAELVGLMDVTGNSIYSGKTILLENNIDLAGKTVKGIGSDVTNFAGTFDGQGFTISNFKIDATDRDHYAGLFNQVSHGGTVKNLTVKNATVVGNSMVGAVASSVDGNSVIDNCKAIDCTVIGVKKVGAVVGYSAGSTVTNNYAENCTVLYSEKEGGEVLGYENTGSTVDNNTFKNVSVNQYQGVAITSADELVALGGTNINGTYVLMADLDMTGKEMKSMVLSKGATVNFIGNGHTISNLNLGAAKINGMTGDSEVAGLFDLSAPTTATVSLTVSDLTIKNAEVACTGYAAAIVGYTSNGNSVITLNNVDVDGAKVEAATVAALVGYTTGKVNLNGCDVSNLTLSGEKTEKTGAYVGTANTADCVVTVVDCTNGTTYSDYGRVINGATAN